MPYLFLKQLHYLLFQSVCQVEIDVLDRNDNRPVFVHERIMGWVDEHAEPGTVVLIVRFAILFFQFDFYINPINSQK